jgi:hypothetical protein
METPSSTCDEGSELDARSQFDYADFDDLDRPPRGHRWEPSSDVSSECSGEPGSPYGSSPYPRWPVCALPARVPKPPPPLLKRLSTTRRAGGGVREGKPGDGGRSRVPRRKASLSLAFDNLLDAAGLLITCPEFAELQLIKERFSKLLLGEDMSGSGKGVSTSVAISNAITNLYGQQRMLILAPQPRLVRNRAR